MRLSAAQGTQKLKQVYNFEERFTLKNQKFPPFFPIFITGMLLAAFGWVGVAYIILMMDPELFPRWLFFFLIFLGLSGVALPLAAFLNRRFPSEPPAGEGVLIRQAAWAGIYGSLLVWLQQGRILNPALIIFLAVGFILIEILLRMGERARWKPKEPQND
jgi:hypothetical protein